MKKMKCFFCKTWWKETPKAVVRTWFGNENFRVWICPDCYERLARAKRFRDYILIERIKHEKG